MKRYLQRSLLPFLLALVLCLLPSHLVQAQTAAEQKIDGYPVQLDRQELFVIQTQVGSFSPEERAKAISARLKAIARDPSVSIDGLTLETTEATSSIVLDNQVLVTVTQADAKAARLEQQQLTQQYRDILAEAITGYRKQRSLRGIGHGLIAAAIATVVFLILVWLLNRLYPKVRDRVCSLRKTVIPDLRLQKMQLISANQSADILVSVVKFSRNLLIWILFYFYATFVLNCFPWTRSFGNNLLRSLWSALAPMLASAVSQIPNLFILAIIFFTAHKLQQLLSYIFKAMEAGDLSFPGFHPEWISPTHKLLKLLLYVMAFMVAFPYIPGSSSPAFRGFSIVIGVLASLGSSTAVTNAIAGIILIYTRSFELGDRIQIGSEEGHVEERSMLVTRIRTRKNEIITIPNATVLSSNVTNFSTLPRQNETPLIISTTVTLGYDVPWQNAQSVLVAAAQMTLGVLKSPEPFVLQTSLDDFYVSHELNVALEPSAAPVKVKAALNRNILDLCNRDGIEILSPHYSAIRDGNHTTIPESYLAQDYQPEGFQLKLLPDLLPFGKALQPNGMGKQ